MERLATAWPMVIKRSLANWKLFSSVVLGVLLASAVMAGTVIFFDSLRDIALDKALAQIDDQDADILMQAEKGPTNRREYGKVSDRVNSVIEGLLAPYLNKVTAAGKSSTFFLTVPGDENSAGKDNSRAFVAYVPDLEGRIKIIDGVGMPPPLGKTSSDGILILEAIVPVHEAGILNASVGSRFSLVPYWDDALPYVTVEIVGLFERATPADSFWIMTDRVLMASAGSSFKTLPLYVTKSAHMDILGAALPDMVSTYGWHLDIDLEKINSSNAVDAKENVRYVDRLLGSELNRYLMKTQIDTSLEEYDTRLLFTKLQMFVVLIMIALVVLYYVVTLSSLVVEQRRFEVSQLRSRGASASQILAVFVLEGGTLSILAAVLGPLIAAGSIGLLGFTPAFSGLSDGEFLPVRVTNSAYGMSVLGALLSFSALMIPAFQASRISVTAQRSESNRPNQKSFVQRYYLDVGLLLVGIVLFRQLTEQGSMAARGILGEVAVNQLLLAVPAVILIAGAMVLLRLFPLVMNLISRVFASRLPVGVVLAIWQMSRNPSNYARLSLLLILMTGLGIFAASFGGTLDRSSQDRALYKIGSDLRLESVSINRMGVSRSITRSYQDVDGIKTVSPVLRGYGSDLTNRFSGESITFLGVEPSTFSDVAIYRDDFSKAGLEKLLSSLEHDSSPTGIQLPENTRALGVLVKVDRAKPSVALVARLRDANKRYFTYELGTLDSTNWTFKEVELFGSRRPWRQLFPQRPLSLMSVSIVETNARGELDPGSILLDSIKARRSTGEVENIETFSSVDGWHVLKNVPDAEKDRIELSSVSAKGDGSLLYAWSGGSPITARGVYPGADPSPMPALASVSFLRDSEHSIGDNLTISLGGRRSSVRITDSFDYFPTLNTIEDKFILVGLEPALTNTNIGALLGGITPNEIWLSAEPGLSEDEWSDLVISLKNETPFPIGSVLDTRDALSKANIDPLVKAGWKALLFIAFGAILLLSAIGFVSHAYVSFRNREVQFALMRTIGLSMNQLISLIWLEQALIIIVGMSLGTWMGARLGAVIMPFLGSDDQGAQVVPPFIMQVDWTNLLTTYLGMVVVFTLVIVGVIFLIRRMSLNRALRLGEM